MNEERLLKVILAPHVSEKSTMVGDKANQYIFKVASDANKQEVKSAVEFLFKVSVSAVRILNVKSKARRFRQIEGRKKGWKKAYVTLSNGEINFSGLE